MTPSPNPLKLISAISVLFLLLFQLNVQAEGTKELRPTSSDNGYIVLDPAWSNFAQYGCASTSRLNIHVQNVGEKVYFGFQQGNNDLKFRIKNEFGTIVFTQANVPSSGAGYISSYSKAVAGPSAIVGSGGYDALLFTPTAAGDYYIEFTGTTARREFELFDITVATAANVAIPGRVWSQAWMISTRSYTNVFKGKFFMYADDGIVTSVDFNGTQPYVFVVSGNRTGTQDTDDFVADRKSRSGNVTYPKYKVFLNNPELISYPTGSFGNLTAPTTISGCGSNRFINVTVDKPGDIFILLDISAPTGYQAGTRDVLISASVTAGLNQVPWNGKDGLLSAIVNNTSIPIQIDYLNGLTHLPLYDIEYNQQGYKVALVRPSGAAPKVFWDDSQIPGGTSNLTGCTGACHTWTWGGSDNSAIDYGNRNTINTWWYANIITTNANITVNDITVDANRLNSPLAANDTTVCSNTGAIPLHGLVAGATTTGVWSGGNGGSFSSTTNLNATYTLSAAEISSGKTKLILTSTGGSGTCVSAFDSLVIRIIPGPTVNAGPPQTVCANNPTVTLAGSKTVATRARWTGGLGTYVPNDTTRTAKYTPTAAEISATFVNLTFTTYLGNGICPAASSTVKISYSASPTSTPGSAQTVCANNPVVSLTGAVGGDATSQTWSGGTGAFSSTTNLTTTYTPSASEISAAPTTVNLKLTAHKAGCTSVNNTVAITINAAPTSNAGTALSVCKNNPVATLNGSKGNGGTSQTWSGGTGTFSDNSILNPTYTPSATEIAAAPTTVTLFMAVGKSGCTNVSSQVVLSITGLPTMNAGPENDAVCANKTLALNGVSATPITWIGAGTFIPDNHTLTATYTPSATEITNQLATVVMVSDPTSICASQKDTITVFITPAPEAEAGSDQSVCKNNPVVSLEGETDLSTSTAWTGGSGTFSDPTQLITTYTPTASELSAGSVTLTFSASSPSCNTTKSTTKITFTAAPVLSAGSSQTVCANNPVVTLNGSSSTGSGQWTGGSGTFSSNGASLTSTYTPSATELSAAPTTIALTLTSTNHGNCLAVVGQMNVNISASPTAFAGNDKSVCANNPTVSLTGTSSTGTGTWSGGTGTFSTPNSITTNYTPSTAETAAAPTTINLLFTVSKNSCANVSDPMILSITTTPTISAGSGQTVCANNPTVTLSGSGSSPITAFSWSGGTGTYTPDNTSATASYTPSSTEITAGQAVLLLSSTAQGTCAPVSQSMTITISGAPSAYAGADQGFCGPVTSVNLTGTKTNAASATWSTNGTGSFGSTSSLTTTYTPSAADLSNAFVLITLTTPAGVCQAFSDEMMLRFETRPSIQAGPAQTVCANDVPVQLDGFGSPATWTGGAGNFSSASNLRSTYTPSAGEISAAPVDITLTLSTAATTSCPVITSQMIIHLKPAPSADAGPPISICGNGSTAILSGSSESNATSRTWVSNGSGTFTPDAVSLHPTYTPSSQDITAGTVTLTLTSTSGTCTGVSDQTTVSITTPQTVNAGVPQSICSNISTVQLNGNSAHTSGTTWTVVSGTGNLSSNSILNPVYTRTAADTVAGSVTFQLAAAAIGACPAQSSQVVVSFTPSPSVNAGSDMNVCANTSGVVLSGTMNAQVTEAKWTTTGTGVFTPNAFALNATYVPSSADTLAGSVNLTLTSSLMGTCSAVNNQMAITFSKAHIVNAGSNQTVCINTSPININGSISHASASTWTTNGSGTFANAAALSTTYTPSAADKTSGTVSLTLTTTANACSAEHGLIVITFDQLPQVEAGFNRSVCANNPSVNLIGTLQTATAASWSGGTGSFSDANNLTTTYTPSAAETSAAPTTVKLLLTSTAGNGTCAAVLDSVKISITPVPVVTALASIGICADSGYVQLASTVSTGSGLWSTNGTGTFTPNAATINARYVPSTADITSGAVTLTLASQANGSCNSVSGQTIVNISPTPTAFAGNNETICATATTVNLTGIVTVATGGKWITSGTGTFANATNLSTTYTPSAADKAAGTVVLTLKTTVGTGTCDTVSHSKILTIKPKPVVSAGSDATICGNTLGYNLSGSFSNTASVTWSTNGTGVFSSNTDPLATYFPSDADKTSGTVTLTLSSASGETCSPVSKSVIITITGVPLATAGDDVRTCGDAGAISLNGSVTGVTTTGKWTSAGSGSFSPNANTLNATYQPSAADISAGSVTLTLRSTHNGACVASTDNLIITLDPIPTVTAGSDQNVCGDVEEVVVSATITQNAPVTWHTSGTGSFVDATLATASYSPSPSDVTSGKITLSAVIGSINGCKSYSSQLNIFFTPIPTLTVGDDITVCTGATSISLNAALTVATTGTWNTDGGGTFSPDANSLNAAYIPSIAENVNGNTVTLEFVSAAAGACGVQSDELTITFSTVAISAGSSQTVCTNNFPVQLHGSGSGVWSTAGDGSFSDVNSLNSTYVPGPNDITAHSATLTLTSLGVGSCVAAVSNVTITINDGPTSNAGSSQTVCANVSSVAISGTLTVATQGVWTSSGTGTFGSASSASTNYTPSSADLQAGNVVLKYSTTDHGICKQAKDTMTVFFEKVPVVTAGSDQTQCRDVTTVQLAGTAQNVVGVVWTKVSGSGSFDNANSLTPIYTASAGDLNGSVTLRITSTGTGLQCAPDDADVTITFTAVPTVTVGSDITVCQDSARIELAGVVGIAGGGIWSTNGTGTFSPNVNTLNATYIPSTADQSQTDITLTLTTDNNGTCNSRSANKLITFTTKPTLTVSSNLQTLCSDISLVTLGGTSTGSADVKWTTTGTGTFADDANASTTYTPSAQDKANGGVNLKLETLGNAPCKELEQYVSIIFTPAPTSLVNAGQDQILCKDVTEVQLNGIITIASGGKWSVVGGATGGSFTPSDSNLTAKYLPSALDKSNGSVTLRLTTTGNGICGAVADDVIITFSNGPTLFAGSDRTVCGTADSVTVTAKITVATQGAWTTGGSGIFVVNAYTLQTSYVPSAEDITNGQVGLTVTSQDNGTCNAISDTVLINFTTIPMAFAGDDIIICSDATDIPVSGQVNSAAGGGLWISGGTGFFDNNFSLTTTYQPSAADIAATRVILTLITDDIGTCEADSDRVIIDFTPAPTSVAGASQSVCADVTSFSLNGKVTVATGGIWSTNGSGSFIAGPSILNPSYHPSSADKTAGSVILTLTTSGNGTCNAVSSNLTLTIDPIPVVSAGSSNLCVVPSSSIGLSGTVDDATGGQWTTSGSGTFSPNAFDLNAIYFPSTSDATAGSVTLSLTSAGQKSCNPVTNSITLFVGALPLAAAGSDQFICPGGNATLTAASASGLSYEWSVLGGSVISNVNTASVVVSGNTNYVVAVTDARGCLNRDTTLVSIVPDPLLALDNHYCYDYYLNLHAAVTNGSPFATYQWYEDNVLIEAANDSVYRVSAPGAFKVTYTLGSCTYSDQTTVTRPPLPITPDSVIACQGASALLSTKLFNTFTYTWSTGASGPGQNTATLAPVLAGEDFYYVTVTDAVGCSATDSILVIGIVKPIVQLADVTGCQGDEITLDATPTNIAAITGLTPVYSWKQDNNAVTNTEATLLVTATGEYVGLVTYDQCSGTDTSDILLNPVPVVSLQDIVKNCFDGNPSVLLDAGTNGTIYAWSNSGGATLGSSQTLTVTTPDEYFVLVTNTFNCSTKDSVEVLNICEPKIFIPTGFVPGCACQDDHFVVYPSYISKYKMMVFNRWGEVIFETNEANVFWDGTYRGEPMPMGVYAWLITYEGDPDNYPGVHKLEGKVTILR